MMSFLIDNKQETAMKEWIETHNKDKKCPIYKKRKKQEKLKAKGRCNPDPSRAAG